MFPETAPGEARLNRSDKNQLAIAQAYSEYQFGRNEEALKRSHAGLEENPNAPPDQRAAFLFNLSLSARILRDYDAAIAAAEELVMLGRASVNGPIPSWLRYREAQVEMLQLAQARKVTGAAIVPARTTNNGRTSVTVSINGETIEAFVDTGAEASAISPKLAERLGFRVIEGVKVPARQIFGDAHYERLAASPPIRVGDMVVENSAFLIADPDKTEHPNLILGLPFFEQVGRVAFLDRGKRIAFGEAAPDVECLGGEGVLFRHKDGVGVSVGLSGALAPAHYDTGFPRSYVNQAPLSFYAPDLRIRRYRQGPGKIARSPLVIGEFREFEFELDGEEITERNVLVFNSPDPKKKLDFPLVVGGTTTRRLDVMALDFETMRYAAMAEGGETLERCLDASGAAD